MTNAAPTLVAETNFAPLDPLPPMDDPRYFPASFLEHLNSNYYGCGIDLDSYREYMRTEIQRGREIVRVINNRTDISGKRVLDVGCGYAGLLITMKEAGAASLTGIEVDPNRLEWGRKRLDALGYDADIFEYDVCQPGAPERLGTFDIVLAQDVIEHVLEPSVVIRHLCQMLRPNGVVYVQVGNKLSPDQLVGDHHYRLPGITMLSREQAIEYFCTRLHLDRSSYAVGCWHDEKYYRGAFKSHGVQLDRADNYAGIDNVVWYANAISEMCTQLKQNLWPDLRPELGKRMKRRMLKIAQVYVHASRQLAEIAAERPELLEEACDAITGRILTGVLRFVGRKPNGTGSGL